VLVDEKKVEGFIVVNIAFLINVHYGDEWLSTRFVRFFSVEVGPRNRFGRDGEDKILSLPGFKDLSSGP
jgi:hypothetical protein